MSLPLYQEIEYKGPALYFKLFSDFSNTVFCDGNSVNSEQSKYSFIAIDPAAVFLGKDGVASYNNIKFKCLDPLEYMKNKHSNFSHKNIPSLPPFQGGFAGVFSYDFARYLENIPSLAIDDKSYYDFAFAYYDLVISFNHASKQAWIVSNGFPEDKSDKRTNRAKARIKWLEGFLSTASAPAIDLTQCGNITSNFTRPEYKKAITKCMSYIRQGDIFEANLAQRFQCDLKAGTEMPLYLKLRELNNAPFSAYSNIANTHILSTSPERFLSLKNRQVEARPIKGTSRRSTCQIKDAKLAQQLCHSAKDRAENIMIVDLMRNDLSRVSKPASVAAAKLCGLESYANVHHLVSVIKSELNPNEDAFSLLKAAFPGGSITGAPKIRAMAIIDELEPHRRGPYCGSLGYISANGDMDFSILIRTLVIKDNIINFHSGGAITLNSDPEAEYMETIVKAEKLQQALNASCIA